MIQGEQIIVFGFPKWEGDYLKSTVHLAKQLAKHNQVLYVDYPFTVLDVWRGIRGKSFIPVSEIIGFKDRLRLENITETGSLHLLRLPPSLPTNWTSAASTFERLTRWNAGLFLPSLRKAMRKLGFEQPIIINAFLPGLGVQLKGRLNEKLLVYYCYDEIGSAPWIEKHGARVEDQFLPAVDLVITSSDPLAEKKKRLNPHCTTVKNGVDLACFGKKDLASIEPFVPATYQQVVGYIGSIDDRLDYDLLSQLFGDFPEVYFAFVGRQLSARGTSILQSFPNVGLLGPRPVEELATYVKGFDVGIIPFVKNELTAAIYPLKINEYLARGKAVLSTDFTDLSEFGSLIEVEQAGPDFSLALQRSLAEKSQTMSGARREMARQNSWDRRGEELSSLLARALETKKGAIPAKKRIMTTA
jgi:hypothetical protein